jgi:biopolymer transport protein ExbB/TolQ
VPLSSAVSPVCDTVACAVNHLSEVVEHAAEHDFFDIISLVSQILIGILGVILGYLSVVLTRRIAEEERRYRRRERKDQKRYRKEQAREQRKEIATALRRVLEARDDPNTPERFSLWRELSLVVSYMGELQSPGLVELLSDISEIADRREAALDSNHHIPREWTRSAIEGSITSWIQNPKRYLESLATRAEIDDLLNSLIADQRPNDGH